MAEVIFTWDGRSASFDLDELTFDEAGEIERVTGEPLHLFSASLGKGFVSSVRVAAWIAFRRESPDLRLADFGSGKLTDLTFEVVGDAGGEAPTRAGRGDTNQ